MITHLDLPSVWIPLPIYREAKLILSNRPILLRFDIRESRSGSLSFGKSKSPCADPRQKSFCNNSAPSNSIGFDPVATCSILPQGTGDCASEFGSVAIQH